MHLVYQAREGNETPAILKPGLVPPSKRKGAGMGMSGPPAASAPMPGAVPVLPMGNTPLTPRLPAAAGASTVVGVFLI